MRHKKQLGQCFLVNEAILAKIAEECLKTELPIVEIGCGIGNLTKPLAITGRNVYGIEIDRDCAPSLEALGLANFTFEISNALKHTYNPETCYVGNLPYNVGTAILIKAVKSKVKRMVFLLQREVVERICAKVDTSEYGSLSVLVQAYYNVESKLLVKPQNFRPQPKVDSKLVVCNLKNDADVDFDSLSALLRASFSAPRKTLKNNLKSYLPQHAEHLLLNNGSLRPGNCSREFYLQLLEEVKGK